MTVDDFNVGDRVQHMSGPKGMVEAIEDGAVVVKYDPHQGIKKGFYDEAWFRMYPAGLSRIESQ
jgi:preprotein translocase subunit YajC